MPADTATWQAVTPDDAALHKFPNPTSQLPRRVRQPLLWVVAVAQTPPTGPKPPLPKVLAAHPLAC